MCTKLILITVRFPFFVRTEWACTILVMDAGVRGALALRLVLWGLWVDDCRVSLLEHLLHQRFCARIVLAVGHAILLHCGSTNTAAISVEKELLITLLFQDLRVFFRIDVSSTYDTLTFCL